jgi:hypothetical protein
MKTEMRSSQKTTKKTKVLGLETYINSSGELEEFQVITLEDRDFNFHKIWLSHIISSLDLIGNQKIRFANFLLEQMDYENKVCLTLRQMSEKSKISLDTVRITIKTLKDSNFVKSINMGVYQINPDIIFKGTMKRRLNVLYKYNTLNPDDEETISNEVSVIDNVDSEVTDGQLYLDE